MTFAVFPHFSTTAKTYKYYILFFYRFFVRGTRFLHAFFTSNDRAIKVFRNLVMNFVTFSILMIVSTKIIQKILESTFQEIDVSDKHIFLTLFCIGFVYQFVTSYTYYSQRWAKHLAPDKIGFMTFEY